MNFLIQYIGRLLNKIYIWDSERVEVAFASVNFSTMRVLRNDVINKNGLKIISVIFQPILAILLIVNYL